MRLKIAILAGDGIGPEVTHEPPKFSITYVTSRR
jgi:isocitrate/isopropylmalate dehydrogenase